jgi:hypothetical protein
LKKCFDSIRSVCKTEKHEVNSITLNTFIEAYKEIFEGFFETKIEIQIGLPEEGGWRATLGVVTVVASFIGIDNLSILVRGQDSKDLFFAANKYITKFLTKKAENTSEDCPRKCLEQKNKIFHQNMGLLFFKASNQISNSL